MRAPLKHHPKTIHEQEERHVLPFRISKKTFFRDSLRFDVFPMSVSLSYDVGIVGATGAVGIELIRCLHRRSFPVKTLHLYASAKSTGKTMSTEFGDVIVEEFSVGLARSCQYLFLAVSSEFALENAKSLCAEGGPVVIDNSSAFRYWEEIPLVVSSKF